MSTHTIRVTMQKKYSKGEMESEDQLPDTHATSKCSVLGRLASRSCLHFPPTVTPVYYFAFLRS